MLSHSISRFMLCGAIGCAPAMIVARPLAETSIGLPITRSYTFEDIGEVSRGARLDFDRLGRLAVVGPGAYVVLNDASWLDIASKDDLTQSLLQVVTDEAGQSYFGSLANWGVAEYMEDGRLRARSLRPEHCPEWVAATNFTHIISQPTGVYFGGMNGLLHWDRATGRQTFYQVDGISAMFIAGAQVFVSSHHEGLQYIDHEAQRLARVADTSRPELAILHATELSDGRALVYTVDRQIWTFDGERMTPWPGPFAGPLSARVSSLQRLCDGGLAIAIDGKGLFIYSEQGEFRLALTSPEYHRIHALAAREPGVLWVASEGAVLRSIYGSPVTIVDQRLGLTIGWPQIAAWNGRTLVASGGRLYGTVLAEDGLSNRFELIGGQPSFGVWAIAARETHLLVGNGQGLFRWNGEIFVQVISGMDVNRLVMIRDDFCYVIGANEIAAVQRVGDQWTECAPRLPGVGFPAVVHAAGSSAWVELGVRKAARISFAGGKLTTRVFSAFPWSDPRWVNVGVVGNLVILSGGTRQALFFDEGTGELCASPEIQQLLATAPYAITRLSRGPDGTLWGSHERGVVIVGRDNTKPHNFRCEDPFAAIVRDRDPIVQFSGSHDIWFSTEKTLYHVNRRSLEVSRPPARPFLVSVTNGRTGTELYSAPSANRIPTQIARFPYAQNSLTFRFFSGGYFWMRAPQYQFRMSRGSTEWPLNGTDSLLVLNDLQEGTYRLEAQLLNAAEPPPNPVVVEFVISPPWYRSTFAYVGYAAAAGLGGLAVVLWTMRRTRQKNAFLENLVRERTDELRSAMAKLKEETRNAATLAERNRLAGEIHDSLQQGLSGLMLQLDATLKLAGLAPDLRTRLTVARNMVSFTRHEVQQAVWDLESPLLENGELADALRKMASLISSGTPRVEVRTNGTSARLDSSTKHQLLRIAQEAITNAVRHGNAENILVHLEYTEATASLAVVDNGRGFVPQEIFANGIGHFGLRGLRSRAAKINGDLQIVSAPGQGATVRIILPLGSDTAVDATAAAL